MPDITVVIPCYNGAAHLGGAIASALEQSHANLTVVVVDDASVDHSVDVAESFIQRGYPVRCIALPRNGGPATARNAAIEQATTPFIAFLDADDRWERTHCESLLALLTQNPDADLAFARTQSADQLTPVALLPVPTGRSVAMLEQLLDDSFIPQSAVLARRSSILAVGGYADGTRYSEDYDLWLRMAHGHRFIASATPSCIRTSHEGQATRHAERMYRGAWEARTRYLKFARRTGEIVPPQRYQAICESAYDRDVANAWRSRSLSLFRSVLALSSMVPGGDRIRRRWTWRALAYWPLWRLAAFCWDALPGSLRRQIKPQPAQPAAHAAPVS